MVLCVVTSIYQQSQFVFLSCPKNFSKLLEHSFSDERLFNGLVDKVT
jgi:hypothetical protein